MRIYTDGLTTARTCAETNVETLPHREEEDHTQAVHTTQHMHELEAMLPCVSLIITLAAQEVTHDVSVEEPSSRRSHDQHNCRARWHRGHPSASWIHALGKNREILKGCVSVQKCLAVDILDIYISAIILYQVFRNKFVGIC